MTERKIPATGSKSMIKRMCTISLLQAAAAILLALILTLCPGIALGQTGGAPADPMIGDLDLEGLSDKEKEKIRAAAVKLMRIHKTIGDPGRGETSHYLKSVDELARFLKRGTVEEIRRLTGEAEIALHLVDRPWIDRAFHAIRQEDQPLAASSIGKLAEQKSALHHVGELVKRAQAIPAKQKKLETAIERGYRNLIRLNEEGHHTFDSIEYAPVRAQLEWIVHQIDQTLITHVRPAHDRQGRLLEVHRRVLKQIGSGKGGMIVRLFREYSSKVMVIQRRLDEIRSNSD